MWFYRWLHPERIRRLFQSQRPAARHRVAERASSRKTASRRAEITPRAQTTSSKSAPPERVPGPASINGRLTFEVDAELSAQLWLAARLQDTSPETLMADLLARGLEQEAFRVQAEAALATLTPREQEIAWLTAQGQTNRQIAEALVISPETVKTHVRHVLDKFNVHSKADLRLLFIDLGVHW